MNATKCQNPKCKRAVFTRGYCKRHYQQVLRHDDLGALGYDLTGLYRLLPHELEIHPFGWTEAHRPKWHQKVKF